MHKRRGHANLTEIILSGLIIFIITTDVLFTGSFAMASDNRLNSKTINSDYVLHIKKAQGEIVLDGVIDEADWQVADVATDFYMVMPYDTSYSEAVSEIRMTYDDQAIYLSLVFYDVIPGPRPVESLRRDFSFGNNDNFLLFLDPFNDQTTG